MNERGGPRTTQLLGHVLLPVANERDARRTAEALAPYDPDRVTGLHVVEKGEGVPDKTPVEQSEGLAAEAFAIIEAVFPAAETRTVYDRDVVEAILAVAEEIEASAIAFCPREGGRLVQFLSGDLATKLVTGADRPVIALPRPESSE